MRIVIGICLIIIGSVLFTLLLSENTLSIMASLPLVGVGIGYIYLKIHEMENKIDWLEMKLDELNKGEMKK